MDYSTVRRAPSRALRSNPCRASSTRRCACSARSPSRASCRRASSCVSPRSSTAPVLRISRSREEAASRPPYVAASRARGSGSGCSRRARRRRSRWRSAAASSSARARWASSFAERFVACAAESGIDVFRLHDPCNDVEPCEAARPSSARPRVRRRARLQPCARRGADWLVEKAQELPDSAPPGYSSRPPGSLSPLRACELVGAVRDASGLPVGLYSQGAGGTALAAASRRRALAPTS